MRPHARELLVGRGEVCLGLVELGTLGRHVEVDVVVDADVDDPVAQASRRGRLARHVLVVELGVGLAAAGRMAGGQAHRVLPLGIGDGASVLAYLCLGRQIEAILIVVLQGLEELARVAHHLLGAVPRDVELLEVGALGGEHVRDRGGHIEHGGGRRAETLELAESVLVEAAQRSHGLKDGGLGRGEVLVGLHLELGDALSNLSDLGLLDGGLGALLRGNDRLLAHHNNELVRLLGLDRHEGRLLLERDLHVGYLLLSVGKLDQTLGQLVLEHLQRGAVLEQLVLVQRDQLEVRLGRRIHLAPLEPAILLRGHADRLVHEGHVVAGRLLDLRALHRDVAQEALGDGDERLLGPVEEPVARRAGRERRELAAPVAHLVADGRHAQANVQQRAHAVDEKLPELLLRVHVARLLRVVAHAVADGVAILLGEEAGRVA